MYMIIQGNTQFFLHCVTDANMFEGLSATHLHKKKIN